LAKISNQYYDLDLKVKQIGKSSPIGSHPVPGGTLDIFNKRYLVTCEKDLENLELQLHDAEFRSKMVRSCRL
jgi:hypothetical protein